MWLNEKDFHDLLINILGGILSGVLIFFGGLQWKLVSSFLSRERAAFRRIFGRKAIETGLITVTLDTYKDLRLLSPDIQKQLNIQTPQSVTVQSHRFYKVFPDGHTTAFQGAFGDILGYCAARAAGYLINRLARLRNITVRTISDSEVAHQWEGTFINLGSSASNIKTDNIKHLPENPWILDDLGEFKFKDGKVIKIDQSGDKAIILKIGNPYFPGYSLIVCAGLGEWGGSGSVWFLSAHWRRLSSRFGRNPFLIVLNVTPGSDESAREILSYGEDTFFWRIRTWLKKSW